MKNILSITAFFVLLAISISNAQDITNTLAPNGSFIIKNIDGSAEYLSLSQPTGFLSLNRCLVLPNTTSSSLGVIFKEADRFIHNYGTNNTFIGLNSGNFTMTGGYNTAMGFQTLSSNTTGYYNSAFGEASLNYNTTASYNSAFGYYSLVNNTTGGANSAFGHNSLAYNTIGDYNSAFGERSLYSNTTGYGNSAFGRLSGSNITTGHNNIAIGYNAQVPDGTASNQVRIGNSPITYAGIQVAWTITSDRRWKENIQPSNLGLGFISKLNPVLYTRKNDENQKTEYGLIAQELEEVLKSEGIKNAGMLTVTDEGYYELRYNDLLSPMIKAIQELKSEKDFEIAKLTEENEQMRSELAELKLIKEQLSEIQGLREELIEQINMLKEGSSEDNLKFSSNNN